jgi:predicted DNA-binding protein (MmcQ/YjbR family)
VTPQAFDRACRALPAATMDVQWGNDHVYKVGGRMFAVTCPRGGASFKVSNVAFEALTAGGRARRAPYMPASASWVRFDDLAALDEQEVADWLAQSHRLVAAKLTRKARRELGLE